MLFDRTAGRKRNAGSMLVVLSPAKNLDYESALPPPLGKLAFAEPRLLARTKQLVRVLKGFSGPELSKLMGISKPLAELNRGRYQQFSNRFDDANSRPALAAFNGDVYRGFELEQYSKADFQFAEKMVRILSGLYGVLRPLDRMQPYRLEMGTKLSVGRTKDLYGFWAGEITALLAADLEATKSRVLVNLASQEYFKSVRPAELGAPIVSPVFKEKRDGGYRVIALNAKRARGIMTNYLVRARVRTIPRLLEFAEGGYRYNPGLSTEAEPVFTRD